MQQLSSNSNIDAINEEASNCKPQNTKKQREKLLLEQVALDLEAYISQSNHPKRRLRYLSEKTNVHIKTLQRLLTKTNFPTPQTLLKIYSLLTNSSGSNETFEKCPDIVKKYLSKNPKLLHEIEVHTDKNIESQLLNNPIYGELYILCATGGITAQAIKDHFGSYGLSLIQSMHAQQIVKTLKNGLYVLANKQVSLTPKILFSLGTHITKRYTKPENGDLCEKMHFSFVAESLSEEGYEKWLEIDENAYQEKIKLVNNSYFNGSKKVFSFSVVDTLELNPNLNGN